MQEREFKRIVHKFDNGSLVVVLIVLLACFARWWYALVGDSKSKGLEQEVDSFRAFEISFLLGLF